MTKICVTKNNWTLFVLAWEDAIWGNHLGINQLKSLQILGEKKISEKRTDLVHCAIICLAKKTSIVEFQQAAGKPCLATTLIHLICPQHFDFEIWVCCIDEK